MPPTPKPPGQRRRRNTNQPQWRQLPASGRKGKAPALPRKSPAWLKSTRDWWETIWASPMATAWLSADVPALCRLALLVDDLNRGGEIRQDSLSEMRQLEDRFGLTPKARRGLFWEVKQAEADEDDGELAPVRHLRAVDGNAG